MHWNAQVLQNCCFSPTLKQKSPENTTRIKKNTENLLPRHFSPYVSKELKTSLKKNNFASLKYQKPTQSQSKPIIKQNISNKSKAFAMNCIKTIQSSTRNEYIVTQNKVGKLTACTSLGTLTLNSSLKPLFKQKSLIKLDEQEMTIWSRKLLTQQSEVNIYPCDKENDSRRSIISNLNNYRAKTVISLDDWSSQDKDYQNRTVDESIVVYKFLNRVSQQKISRLIYD